MNVMKCVETIKHKFSEGENPVEIPLLRGDRKFTAELTDGGILVSNLGAQDFLPWEVFQETICLLMRSGGIAKRGNAMDYKLGEPELSFDSIEGHIAQVVYGKKEGDTVFRRVTPIVCILAWAGVCRTAPGEVILR